ncbi:hypothetical protein [Peterkaempfera sp. SMS 1(5)a]|uniref:hypothetical protein n=1 Tax=Peterkaempfera podocarpi TaxID=3232308 RepID=UPI00366AF9D3
MATTGRLAHAIEHFPYVRVAAARDPVAEAALLAGLDRRGVARRVVEDGYRLLLEVDLHPGLERAVAAARGMYVSLGGTAPLGDEDTEEDDCTTETTLDAMVSGLGPPTLDVQWEGPLQGLPDARMCGVQLCLNSEWTSRHAEPCPGAFNVHLSIGTRLADQAVMDEWLRDSGLPLGAAQPGW